MESSGTRSSEEAEATAEEKCRELCGKIRTFRQMEEFASISGSSRDHHRSKGSRSARRWRSSRSRRQIQGALLLEI